MSRKRMLHPATPAPSAFFRGATLVATLAASALLSGCGSAVGFSIDGSSPGQPPPGYAYLTGNWQIDASNSPGKPTFSALAGFIAESGNGSGTDTLTSVFQIEDPAPCFAGQENLPMSGGVTGTAVSMDSFSDTGQMVHLKAAKDSTATQLTGTYVVGGGCSTGGSGTITGTRYAPLTGTYAGSVGDSSLAQTLSFSLTQASLANGGGYTPLSGTGTFAGFTCFTSGTLNPASSYVLGRSVHLTVNATDGENVTLTGTFDPAASAIAISSGQIAGGACSGSLGSSTLSHS